MDLDLTPDFLAAIDKVLAQLWMRGYAVLPAPDVDGEAADEVEGSNVR